MPFSRGTKRVLRFLTFAAMVSGAGCKADGAPAPADAPGVAAQAVADDPPRTSEDWAAVLRAVVRPDPRNPRPVLIVSAESRNPPADTLLAAGRLLQAAGVVDAVCALPITNWDCHAGRTQPRYRVNRARADANGLVRVELYSGWYAAPGDTTPEAIIGGSVCSTSEYRLRRRAAGSWAVVGTRSLAVC